MSTPFTDISQWQHLQDTDAANEIVQAYNERRQCVGASTVDLLSKGSNAQDTAFWRGIQQWILNPTSGSTISSFWVDDSASIQPNNEGTALPILDLSRWKTNSGLYDGFRRATTWPSDWTDYDDPAYSYGVIQAGDIRGPWIFEDLQKGLDALRWTDILGFDSIAKDQQSKIAQTDFFDTAGEAINDAKSKYNTLEWQSSNHLSYYLADFVVLLEADLFGVLKHRCQVSRRRAKMECSIIPNHISHIADFVTKIIGNNDCDPIDLQNWAVYETFASAKTTTRTTQYHPYVSFPEPSEWSVNQLKSSQATVTFADWILKWEFSHTL
jgi:hypothetical protein